VIPILLSFGAAAFGVSGVVLAIATYKVAKDSDWEAARTGIVLTTICFVFAGALGMASIVLMAGSSAFFGAFIGHLGRLPRPPRLATGRAARSLRPDDQAAEI
jgi:hypothetical protein